MNFKEAIIRYKMDNIRWDNKNTTPIIKPFNIREDGDTVIYDYELMYKTKNGEYTDKEFQYLTYLDMTINKKDLIKYFRDDILKELLDES